MLSQRDCEKLLGSLIGGLLTMADPLDIMKALLRWSEDEELWNKMVDTSKKLTSLEEIIFKKEGS